MTALSVGERDTRRQALIQWRKDGKGKGLRWIMMREVVAYLSLHWMTSTQIQDAMLLHRGLTRKKTNELLGDLESTECIIQERYKEKGEYMWGATPLGVDIWLRTKKVIPAGIVQAAQRIKDVRK